MYVYVCMYVCFFFFSFCLVVCFKHTQLLMLRRCSAEKLQRFWVGNKTSPDCWSPWGWADKEWIFIFGRTLVSALLPGLKQRSMRNEEVREWCAHGEKNKKGEGGFLLLIYLFIYLFDFLLWLFFKPLFNLDLSVPYWDFNLYNFCLNVRALECSECDTWSKCPTCRSKCSADEPKCPSVLPKCPPCWAEATLACHPVRPKKWTPCTKRVRHFQLWPPKASEKNPLWAVVAAGVCR